MRHLAILPIRTHINSLCWRVLRCQVFFCGALTTGTYELVHSAVCVYNIVCVRVRVRACACVRVRVYVCSWTPYLAEAATTVYMCIQYWSWLTWVPFANTFRSKKKSFLVVVLWWPFGSHRAGEQQGKRVLQYISQGRIHVSHARAIAYRYRTRNGRAGRVLVPAPVRARASARAASLWGRA